MRRDKGKMPVELKTKRLHLRAIQAADVPALVALWTDPQVTKFMGGPRDNEKLAATFAADLVDENPPRYDLWPVVDRETEQIVGQCGLLDKEIAGKAEIELVYVFATGVWGKGLATEIAGALRDYAFEVDGLTRLVSLINPENFASQRVAVKTGMHLQSEVVRPGGKTQLLFALDKK